MVSANHVSRFSSRFSAVIVLWAILLGCARSASPPVAPGKAAATATQKTYTLEDVTAGLRANLAKVGSYRSRYTVVFHGHDGHTTYIKEILVWKYDPDSWPDRCEPRRFEQWQYPSRAAMVVSLRDLYLKVTFDGEQTSCEETVFSPYGLPRSSHTSVHEGLHGRAFGRGLTLAELAGRRVDADPVERLLENGTFRVEGVVERDGQPLVVLYGKIVRPDSDDKEMTTPGSYMRLWLDPQRGFMSVRREEYAIRVDQPEPKRGTVFTAELDEVAPGVWFPCAGTYETPSIGQRAELKRQKIDLNIEY